MSVKIFEPKGNEAVDSTVGIILLNHGGSNVSQDTGRDAQALANGLATLVIAADRPGTDGIVPNSRLARRLGTLSGYVAEMSVLARRIDRQIDRLGIQKILVAGRLDRAQKGMYISPDKHHYSILPVEVDGERKILIGGEAHFWGLRGNRRARFQRLADYAEKHFGVTEITHRWSDRDYLAYDSVPLVGKLYPWSQHVYVATACKKWGLTNGTVAAMILHDLLRNEPNSWASTFNSMRLKPISSISHTAVKLLRGDG